MAYRSSGASNHELINNLRSYGLVADGDVYEAFQRVDRGDFVPSEIREQAYYDQPLLHGRIHMSAPHIYATVLSSLDLQRGQSFLNVGSGTGYLSTIAGCLLGGTGVNHGVDLDAELIAHAQACHTRFLTKVTQGKASSSSSNGDGGVTRLDLFHGNIMDLDDTTAMRYDRIYVGAACPAHVKQKLMGLLVSGKGEKKEGEGGGVLIGPMGDELVRVTRVGEEEYTTTYLAAVRFAPLKAQPSIPLYLPKAIWSPKEHHTFPVHFRVAVKALLMAANRDSSISSRLPRSVWLEVLSFMDRQWFNPPGLAKKKGMLKDDSAFTKTTGEGSAQGPEDEASRDNKRSRLRFSLGRRLAARFPGLWPHLAAAAATGGTVHGNNDEEGEDEDGGDDNQGSASGDGGAEGTLAHMIASLLPPMMDDDDDEDQDDAIHRFFMQNHDDGDDDHHHHQHHSDENEKMAAHRAKTAEEDNNDGKDKHNGNGHKHAVGAVGV